jgi:DNA gyrase subunit A
MLVTSGGKVIRLRASEMRVIGRNTQGVRLIDLEEGERLAAVARVAERDEESESAVEPEPGAEDAQAEGGAGEPPADPEPEA